MIRRECLLVAVLAIFPGCMSLVEPKGFVGRLWRLEVGPRYKRPGIDMPDDFRGRLGPEEAASFADLPWWDVFGDPMLQRLVREALASDHALESAAASIEQARAQVGVSASDLLPHAGYQGLASRWEIPPVVPGVPGSTFNFFLGAFDVAWEVDLWGRLRRSTEVARAQDRTFASTSRT